MRLTQTNRWQIVNAIKADVPNISDRHIKDLQDLMEKRVRAIAIEQLPEKVRAIYNDPALREYVNTEYVYSCCVGYLLPSIAQDGLSRTHPLRQAIEADPDFAAAHTAYDRAKDMARDIHNTLVANLNTCKTVKSFVERFPELAKYAPKENAPVQTLPATTALMDSLKAAGLSVEEGE
jgi:hypothetical protein